MVLTKKNAGRKLKFTNWDDIDLDDVSRELGVVRRTGAMGRKRIEPSPCSSPLRTPLKRQCSMKRMEPSPCSSPMRTPLKRQCSMKARADGFSPLEALPQDIVIRILCGVEHDDLGQLLCVSKSMKQAALIAKEGHFAYRTPSSKTATLRSFSNEEEGNVDTDGPILNAPRQERGPRSRRNLSNISVVLFRTPGQD